MNDPLPLLPQEIKDVPNWVVWKLEQVTNKTTGETRTTKIPYNARTGALASSTDPRTWTAYTIAVDAFRTKGYSGLGWMFTLEAGIIGVDLDKQRDPGTGETTPKALDIIAGLDSYTELSPSGKGYHVLIRATLPQDARNRKADLEIYAKERYFTMSGQHVEGTPRMIEARQEQLDAIREMWLAQDEEPASPPARPPSPRPSAGAGSLNAGDRLQKALKNESFAALFNGEWQGKYPSQSEADQAFCNKLAFWFGADIEAMDTVFRQSALFRKKWERESYGKRTLQRAVASCREVYTGRRAI